MTDISNGLLTRKWIPLRHRIPSISAFLLHAMVALLGLGMAGSALAQSLPLEDGPLYVPDSALFLSLGGGLNSIDFGDQDVIAVGTSVLSEGGVTVASGSAGPPENTPDGTPIPMDTQIQFAPSVQAGYFDRIGQSDWLWGAKFTYDYMGSTSTYRRPIFPQVGTFTEGTGDPIPFTGNAVALSTQTEIDHQLAFRPFLGHSFERGFVYFGGGPILSREQTDVLQLVGFADINGNRGDISGAPQDFSAASWVWGGSAEVGVTFFLNRSWFLDCSYVIGITGSHAFNFSSTFSSTFVTADGDVLTQDGTLVGSSTWHTITQGIGIRLGKTF